MNNLKRLPVEEFTAVCMISLTDKSFPSDQLLLEKSCFITVSFSKYRLYKKFIWISGISLISSLLPKKLPVIAKNLPSVYISTFPFLRLSPGIAALPIIWIPLPLIDISEYVFVEFIKT